MSDLDAIVNVHQAAFPGFFLTSMGPAFLGAMYSAFLTANPEMFIAFQQGQTVSGFAVGSIPGKNKINVNTIWCAGRLLTSSMPGAFKNPIKIANKLISRIIPSEGQVEFRTGDALLRSIGVLPECQGQGIGGLLLKEFEEQAKIKGAHRVILTTDAINNARTVNFYRNCGYAVEQEFLQDRSRIMLLFTKQILC